MQTGIHEFDPRKATQMALGTARLRLESNYSPVDRVIFCTYENSDYEIYKDLIFAVFFPGSKCHLTGSHMKEGPNNDSVANIKNIENHNKLVQNIYGLQIYPNTAQKSKSESESEIKQISRKVDFNIVKDPNIPIGLKNCNEKVCFFNSVIHILHSLLIFRNVINYDCLQKE